jgi:hypothetical protein
MNEKPKLSQGVKHDAQKRRFSLFPTKALYAVVDVLEYGARKYAEGNWRDVENARERYYNASMRHINDWWMGETHDPESGHHHLAHAMCCLVFLLTVELEQR